MPNKYPVLYSFRRCPYAMRARLAITSAGFKVELREILLRDKAPEFTTASPKATVPVLVLPDDTIIEESLDVMQYVLARSDPERLLAPATGTQDEMLALIAENDGPFKSALDRYKYANRFDGADPIAERNKAAGFLRQLDKRLASQNGFFCGTRLSLADLAILPFVRQFANVDRVWFDAQDWPALVETLDGFTGSARFTAIMTKYARWHSGDAPIFFGDHP